MGAALFSLFVIVICWFVHTERRLDALARKIKEQQPSE